MDIVERARNRNMPYGPMELIDKLADEIERLRGEIMALHERPREAKDGRDCAMVRGT